MTWIPVRPHLCKDGGDLIDSNALYNMLVELDPASICQSGANIYYQSDRTYLTSLQLVLLTVSDLSCLLPKAMGDELITFQLFSASGRFVDVQVTY